MKWFDENIKVEGKDEDDISDFTRYTTKGGRKVRKKVKRREKKDDDYLDPISYSGLMKHIEENHPRDPDTKERFSIFTRITVKDFGAKIAGGVFMCYSCIRLYQ